MPLSRLPTGPDLHEDPGPVVCPTLSAFTREDAEYWDERHPDHGPNGLFIGGPQPARDPLVALAGSASDALRAHLSAAAAERAESRALRQALDTPAPGLTSLAATLVAPVGLHYRRVRRGRAA